MQTFQKIDPLAMTSLLHFNSQFKLYIVEPELISTIYSIQASEK